MHPWGQRCLLARRLVEAGASFVTMVLENPTSRRQASAEGRHLQLGLARGQLPHLHRLQATACRCYDRCVTALIEDLYARGLDRKVLLIVTGEFGRTPRIELLTNGRPGPRPLAAARCRCWSAAAGCRSGQVVGSTNAAAKHPKDRPLTPERPVGDDVPPPRHRSGHDVPRPPRPAHADPAVGRADRGIDLKG